MKTTGRWILCALLGGLVSLSALAQQKGAEGPVLGVQLYSFREQMKGGGVEQVLKQVKEMGFTDVEAAGQGNRSAAEFRALLDKHGLRVVSLFADYGKMGSDLPGVIADAKALGAKYVVVAWIPHQKQFTPADADRAIAHFNEWGEKLSREGLRFAYHIHGYEFQPQPGGGTLLDKMMAETKPQFVSIEMDVFWVAHPGQDPVKFLQRYGDRVEMLHVKDMQKGLKGDLTGHADVETNVTVGTGQIDYAGVMREARRAGVKYAFIEDESSRSLQQVPASLAYLKSLK